ncbi:hypothetical protein R6Q57_018676 [Mikania cordata]
MLKSQTFITFIPFLLLSSIATASAARPATLNRRGLTTLCNPLFGGCSNQWPFSPITSGNHYISRPFLRHQSPLSVVVPSPPPPVFTNPSFTTPSYDTNPSFSPLVASPPPPGDTLPPVLPELPPAEGGVVSAPPYLALSFSPPAGVNIPPVNTLPPIAGKDQPEVFMSPPEENWPGIFNVPPPPLVPVDSQLLKDAGQVPPVGENGYPPPVAQSPQTA